MTAPAGLQLAVGRFKFCALQPSGRKADSADSEGGGGWSRCEGASAGAKETKDVTT